MVGPIRASSVPLGTLLLVILAEGASGGYTVQKSMNQCAGYCKGTAKFNYEPGTLYHYDYEVDVSSSVEGAIGPGDEPSQMKMRAKAVLAALDSPCDLTLKMKDVKLHNVENEELSEEFSRALERNPLRFSLQHGRVEELCSLPGELPWVLNVKRGLLSALQNSMDDLKISQTVYETDITGNCETRYTAFEDMWWEEELWGGGGRGRKGATPMTTVRRTKDLSSCSERNTYFLSLQANPTGRSKAKHMLRSSHECEQSVSVEEAEEQVGSSEEYQHVGGVLLRSECRERHLFEPFSYRESGALTNVTTRLILKGKEPLSKSSAQGGAASPKKSGVVPYTYSTLLYDHSTEWEGGAEGGGAVEESLAVMEAATADGVSGDAPQAFASLIGALRRLTHSQLMAAFKKAGQGRSRKFLLDAMPVVATASSMSAFRDLYFSGDVSEAEMDAWMGGLSFLKRPTLPMITALMPLLDRDPRPTSVLGITALVRSYCRYGGGDQKTTRRRRDTSSEEEQGSAEDGEDDGEGCRDKEEVRKVIERLEGMLGPKGCRFGRKEEKRAAEAYLALKGLANAGVSPSEAAARSLQMCYMDSEVANDLRLAAIDALRRVPCGASTALRSQLLDSYANVSAGTKQTEVRIAAYVATMRCPSIVVLRRIEDTLHREEVNQVGSFVWTHLTNLRSAPSSSSEPYSSILSELLSSKTLRRKFRSDVRKFSRHYRISTGDAVEGDGTGDWNGAFGGDGGIAALGFGADAEASLVLSPESYIPRSAALNLTMRLFGAEVDLLDVGVRAEGLEPLVETIFGPGTSSDDIVSKHSKSEREESNAISRIMDTFRSRSGEQQRPAEPRGSGYVRVFGNELSFGRFRGLGEMLALFSSQVGSAGRMRGMLRNPVEQLAAALAHQRALTYTRSVAFLDAAMVTPTVAGLPLSLVANGTASVAIEASGRVDITARSEGAFEAEGSIAPSAAVVVSGTMSVSAAGVARSGLRLDATLRTNTRAQGRVRFRKGKLLEATFSAPRAAGEEVLSVSSKLFALDRGRTRALRGRQQNREEAESCTPKPVSRAVGLELCARASYPNATGDDTAPRFPLTGPGLVSFSVGRTDTFEKYEFKYEWKDEVREEERSEGKGLLTDDEYLEEMRLGGRRFRRFRDLLLQFDTPGSKVDRRVRAALAVEGGVGGASLVRASVATPWTRTLEVTAGLENTASARGVGLTATLGGEEVVTAQAELRSVLRRIDGAEGTPSGRYEPSVSISVRGRTLVLLHGRVDYVQGAKYSGDMRLAGDLIGDPVAISGDLVNDGGRYDLLGSVKSSLLEGTVQGNFQRTVGIQKKKGQTEANRDAGKFINAKATFKYSVRGGEMQTFDVSARYLRNAKGVLAKDSAYLTVLSTQFPQYEIDATWDSSTSEGPYFEGRGRLTIGKDGPRWETRPLLVLRGLDHLAFRFFLACRSKKLLYDLSLKHQITDKALLEHALLRMGTNHEISASLNVTTRSHPTARYTLESEVRLPRSLRVGQSKQQGPGQRVLALRASVDEVRRRSYEVEGGVEWWWSSVTGAAKAKGTYSDKGNRTNSDRRMEGKVWVVHGREIVDEVNEEPSLDFAAQVVQADRMAKLTARTEKPRKYKTEVTYTKTGLGEHTLEGWAVLSLGKKYDGKAVVSDGEDTKKVYLELGLGRRMSFDGKLHVGEGLNGLELELFWDKDMNQRLSTGATVEFLAVTSRAKQRTHRFRVPESADHGIVGAIWLEYPGRSIRGQGVIMPQEVTADLRWAQDRAISLALHTRRSDAGANSSLSLETPFQGIEKQSASAEYTWDGKRFHGQLDAHWKQDKESLLGELTMVLPMDGASPWESDADVEINVKSTMASIREALMSISHRASANPLGTSTTASVHWNRLETFFSSVVWALTHSVDRSSFNGSVGVRSAGQHLRSFSADFAASRHGEGNADGKGSLSWRLPFDVANKTLDFGFDLTGLKSGKGYCNLNAPVGDYKNLTTSFEYISGGELGGRSILSSELYLDGERRALTSIEVFFSGAGNANINTHVETPWFSAVELTARHDSRGGEGLRESLNIKYDGDVVAEGELEATLRSSKDFVVMLSGGIGGTVSSARIEHLLLEKSVRSSVEVTIGGETSSATIEARDEEGKAPRGQQWRPRVLHGSMTVTSPRLRSGRLRFAVDFSRSGRGTFMTVVSVPGIEAQHSLDIQDLLNWESRLEAHRGWEGHIKIPVVNITLVNSFDGNSLDHLSHTYMRGLERPMMFALAAKWGNNELPENVSMQASVRIELPWAYPVQLDVEIPSPSPNKEGKASLEARVTLTYGEEEKNMTIISRIEREDVITNITFQVTMHNSDEITFGMKYDFHSEEKFAHLFSRTAGSGQAEAKLTFSLHSSFGAMADLHLSSFGSKEFTHMLLDFDLVGSDNYLKIKVDKGDDDGLMEPKLDILYNGKLERDKYSVSAVMEAPSRISFSSDLDLTMPLKLASIKIRRNGTEYFTLTASAIAERFSAKVTTGLKSVMEGMEDVSFVATYNINEEVHLIDAILIRDGIKSQLNGKLKSEQKITELECVLRLPFVGYEYLKLEAMFATFPTLSFMLGFEKSETVLRLSGNCATGVGFFNASASAITPFEGYRDISASISHSANAASGNMDLRLLVVVQGSETSFYGSVNCTEYYSMKGSILITTPFQGLEKIDASFDYDASKPGHLDGKAHLAIPGGTSQIILSGMIEENVKHAEGRILLSSPYLPGAIGSLGLEAEYAKGRKGEVRINLGNQIAVYSAAVSAVHRGISMVITTPVEGYRRVAITLIDESETKSAGKMILTKEKDRYQLTGRIESLNNRSAAISLGFESPIVGWEEVSARASYEFPPGKEMKAAAEAQRNGGAMLLSARMNGRLAGKAGRASAQFKWNFGSPEASEFYVDGIYDVDGIEKSLGAHLRTPFEGYEAMEAKARVDRDTAFALLTIPSVTYLAKMKREGDRAGSMSLTRNGVNVISVLFDRTQKLMAEVNSSVPGYEGNGVVDLHWTNHITRAGIMWAKGKIKLDGFGLEKASSLEGVINTSKADGGAMLELNISTPLVYILEKFYLHVDYNGLDLVTAKANTVFEGYEDLGGSAKWSAKDAYNILLVVQRGEEELNADIKFDKRPGLFLLTTNLTTPYEGFEDLDSILRFQYGNETESVWKEEIEIKMLMDEEVIYGIEGRAGTLKKALDSELIIYTPEFGYETIVMKFAYDFEGHGNEGKYIKGYSEVEGQAVVMVSGSLKEGVLKSNLNAPSFLDEEIEVLSVAKDWWESEISVRTGKREATLKIYVPSHKKGDLELTSNIEGYERFAVRWQLQESENGSKRLDSSLHMGAGKNGHLLARITPDFRELEMELKLTVSEGIHYRVNGMWEVPTTTREFTAHCDIDWAELGRVLEVEVVAEAPQGAFDTKIRALSSQWREGKEVTLTISFEYEERGAVAESALRWGKSSNETVTLKGRLEVAALKVVSNLELNTPFSEPLLVNLNYDFLRDSPKKVAASYQYGRTRYAVDGEVTGDHFDFQMTTPIPEYEMLKINGRRIFAQTYKEASLAYELGAGSKGEMKASVSSEPNGPYEVNVFAQLDGTERWSLKGMWSMLNFSQMSGDLEVRWAGGGLLTFEMKWAVPEKATFEVYLSEWNAPILVSWTSRVPKEGDHRTNLEVILQSGMTEKQRLRFAAGISPEKDGQTRFEAELDTPGENSNWKAKGTLDRKSNTMYTVKATLFRGDNTLADIEGTLSRRPGNHTKITLKGGEAIFEAEYDLREDKKEARLLAAYGDTHKIAATAKGSVDHSAARGFLLVETSFAGLKKLNMEAELGGNNEEREAMLRAEWEGGRVEITGNGAFVEVLGLVRGRFAIRTPWSPLERVELDITADVKGPTYGVNATVSAAKDYFVSFAGKIDMSQGEGDVTAVISRIGGEMPARFHASAVVRPKELLRIRVETPFLVTVDVSGRRLEDEYDVISDAEWGEGEKMSLKGKIRSQPEDYGFAGEMEWNGRRMTLDAFTKGGSFSPGNCSIEGGFNLTSPFEQFSHMSIFFSLVREKEKLLDGRLRISTPFEAMPSLSGTIALKIEEDQGFAGELTAITEKSKAMFSANIRKDLLGWNQVHIELDLPFLGRSSPITFDCTLQFNSDKWEDIALDVNLLISKRTYSSAVTYAVKNDAANSSFSLNSPTHNFKGGLYGKYQNNSLSILGYLNDNDVHLDYAFDKLRKDFLGNASLTAPGLGIPKAAFTLQASYLQDKDIHFTYIYKNHSGHGKIVRSSRGITIDVLIPPLLTSEASFKLLFAKVSRGNDLNLGFSYGESSHSLNVLFESYNHVMVKGLLKSTSFGDREIDIYLRRDKKIGQVKIGGLLGISWDASQQSSAAVTLIWKETEHHGKFEYRNVGRYTAILAVSSPWLSNGGFNASVLYSNDIESLKAQIKCETKKGINIMSLETHESKGKKTLVGEITTQSERLAQLDSALIFTDDMFDCMLSVKYKDSSHRAKVVFQSFPISLEVNADSDYLKKFSNIPLSVSATIHTDTVRGNIDITTPFAFLHSANLTAMTKMTDNGHIIIESTSSIIRIVNGTTANQILIANIKFPYPVSSHDRIMNQYHLEVMTTPEEKRFVITLNYVFGRIAGIVESLVQLDFGGSPSNYYELKAYGRGSKENVAEILGHLVWAGERVTDVKMEYGASEEGDAFGFSAKVTSRNNDSYACYFEMGEGVGKIDIEWPKNKSININFEHEIESLQAFRVGGNVRTPFDMLDDVSMKIKSVMKKEGYVGEMKLRKMERRISVAIDGNYENYAPNLSLEGGLVLELDGVVIVESAAHTRFLCEGASIGLDLKTPLAAAKVIHFLVGVDWGINGTIGPSLKLEVAHNGREYLATAANLGPGASSGGAFLRTVWTPPSSLRYEFSFVDIQTMAGNFRVCLGECVGVNLTVKGTKQIEGRLELPSRVVGFDWAWVSDPGDVHCSARIMWERESSLGFKLRVISDESALLEVNFPVRSFKLVANSGINANDSSRYSDLYFFWDAARNSSKVLSLAVTFQKNDVDENIDATLTLTHPALRRNVVFRLYCSTLQLPFSGRLELEYSPEKADLFVAETSLERVTFGNGQTNRLALTLLMNHQSSGLDIKVSAEGAAGAEKAGGQLGVQYIDARGRLRTIVLTAKAHLARRSLQLKADTNENSLSITAALENVGLRLETKVNRKPPLTLRLLFDRKMPSATFDADRGRRRYQVYIGSTEAGGPIKSVTVRLVRRDVDDEAPPSTIAVAHAVETVLSGTTFSLNSSRLLSSRFLWEQRGGLRTPDVPATLGAAFRTMGGWIRDAYSDVGHAWAAVAGEAAAGFLGEGTTHKLKLWYVSIEDEVEGLTQFSRMEVSSLVDDFRSLEQTLSQMYKRNDFFIKDIDQAVVWAIEKLKVAKSSVLMALKEAAMDGYVILRKVVSAVLSSASRLVGDAIEATGYAVSSALPDPAEAARRLGEAAGRVAAAARRVGQAARGAARRLSEWAEGVVEKGRQWVEARRAAAGQAVWDWATAEAERLRPVMIIVHSYVLRFKEIVEEVHAVTDEIAISIKENLASVREIMELGEMVDYYTFKARNLKWNETIASLKAYLKRTWETIVDDFKNGLGEYRAVVMKKYDELIGHYDQFMQLPPVVEFTGTVKFIRRKAVWTWHYLELGDYFKTMLSDFVMGLAKAVAEVASQITEESRDPNSAKDISRDSNGDLTYREEDRTFVLEAGYFEYNVKLPFDWDSFDSVPHFRQMWERPKEPEKAHRVPEETSLGPNRPGSTPFTRIRSVVADALLEASLAAAITEATEGEISTAAAALAALALPPFPSSALIAGDTNLVTFDGRDYSFSAAGCSYLLAGDLVGGSFVVLANYDDKGRRRSVSLLLPAETQGHPDRRLDVASDGRVSVEGRRVELPIEVGPASVRREGMRVVVDVGRTVSASPQSGLETLRSSVPSLVLECNPFHNVCTLRISGWIFARTAGLLGTYDNEPSDDFEAPYGRVLSKVEEFTESWHVGNCSGDASAPPDFSPPPPSEAPPPLALEPCGALFDRESDILSPLQPCFSRVDPAPYGRLCEVDVAAASNSPSGWETAACASAAAYVAQCRNAGMDLWVPQSCVRCYLSDGSVLSAGETKVYGGGQKETPPPLSGDVVFLVEQRPCLQGTQISNLAAKLDSAMRAHNLRDNRFALVGFNGGYKSRAKAGSVSGGPLVSRVFGGPHTHTADGKVWSTKRHFEKAFNNMVFDGREGNGPGGRTTPMEALWYAARLPFRDGVSKTVVLIMCGDCSDATDAAYADAVGMLLEGDLTLHVLAPTSLRTKRQPSRTSSAFGFDSVGAFTVRNVRVLKPDPDLLRQLKVPKDLCSPLAIETNGTRFDVTSVLGASTGVTSAAPKSADNVGLKKFRKISLDVFVRRVALTASPSSCQRCDCVADREGVGRVACQRCLFPSMESFFQEWHSLVNPDYEEEEEDETIESDKAISTWG